MVFLVNKANSFDPSLKLLIQYFFFTVGLSKFYSPMAISQNKRDKCYFNVIYGIWPMFILMRFSVLRLFYFRLLILLLFISLFQTSKQPVELSII